MTSIEKRKLERAINKSGFIKQVTISLDNFMTDAYNHIVNDKNKDKSKEVINQDRQYYDFVCQEVKHMFKALKLSRAEIEMPVQVGDIRESVKDINGKSIQAYVRTVINILTNPLSNSKDKYIPNLLTGFRPYSYHDDDDYMIDLMATTIDGLKDTRKNNTANGDKVSFIKSTLSNSRTDTILRMCLDKNLNSYLVAMYYIYKLDVEAHSSNFKQNMATEQIYDDVNTTFNTYLREIGIIDKDYQLTTLGKQLISVAKPKLINNYFHHQFFNYRPSTSYACLIHPLIKAIKWVYKNNFHLQGTHRLIGLVFALHLVNYHKFAKFTDIKLNGKKYDYPIDSYTYYTITLSLFSSFVNSTKIKPNPAVAKAVERLKKINEKTYKYKSWVFDNE